MKRIITKTDFTPIRYTDGKPMEFIKDSNGKIKTFKTRDAVEKYCLKNKFPYIEQKTIFYK